MKQFERFTTYNVNFKATGEYTLGVAEERFIALGYTVIPENYNAVTVGPVSAIGTNSPSYNNITTLPALGIGGSFTAGKTYTKMFNDAETTIVNKGDTVKLKITVAATASSLNASVILFGYYYK